MPQKQIIRRGTTTIIIENEKKEICVKSTEMPDKRKVFDIEMTATLLGYTLGTLYQYLNRKKHYPRNPLYKNIPTPVRYGWKLYFDRIEVLECEARKHEAIKRNSKRT